MYIEQSVMESANEMLLPVSEAAVIEKLKIQFGDEAKSAKASLKLARKALKSNKSDAKKYYNETLDHYNKMKQSVKNIPEDTSVEWAFRGVFGVASMALSVFIASPVGNAIGKTVGLNIFGVALAAGTGYALGTLGALPLVDVMGDYAAGKSVSDVEHGTKISCEKYIDNLIKITKEEMKQHEL